MDDAEAAALAGMTFPSRHRIKLHNANALERVKSEIQRRTPPRLAGGVARGVGSEGFLAVDGRRHLSQ
jgi:hypothetical protein